MVIASDIQSVNQEEWEQWKLKETYRETEIGRQTDRDEMERQK